MAATDEYEAGVGGLVALLLRSLACWATAASLPDPDELLLEVLLRWSTGAASWPVEPPDGGAVGAPVPN